MKEIDFVFPYVDCSDPVWQKAYKETRRNLNLDTNINFVRFRSWDNLRYLFRAIDKNLPFIRKVHMIVSNPEQVPDWLDADKVHVVYHKDFIPKEFLPTFNSCTIEMFLGKIPDLADRFIYGNDDTFPLRVMNEKDFYQDDKIRSNLRKDYGQENQFKKVEYNTQCKAAKAYGKIVSPAINGFLKVQHSINPLNKSTVLYLYKAIEDDIYNSCTKFREEKNINQYLYTLAEYYSNNITSSLIGYDYFSINERTIDSICKCIKNKENYNICINDTRTLEDGFYRNAKSKINNAFESIFPDKCKYEKYLNVINCKDMKISIINGIINISVPFKNSYEENYLISEIKKLLNNLNH